MPVETTTTLVVFLVFLPHEVIGEERLGATEYRAQKEGTTETDHTGFIKTHYRSL